MTSIAEATLGDRYGIDWAAMRDDYAVIRGHISRVVHGCENYEADVAKPGGFVMPHPPRDSRRFDTRSGRAEFVASTDRGAADPARASGAADAAQPRPVQHHHLRPQRPLPRHRGWPAGRDGQPGRHRPPRLRGRRSGRPDHPLAGRLTTSAGPPSFRIVGYQTPRGSAAAYYPETNPLVPLDSTALGSNTPTSKSVIIRMVPVGIAADAGRLPGAGRRRRPAQELPAAGVPVR